jgi:hypothetical protein
MFLQNEPIESWDRIVCVSRTESPRTATDDAAVRELRSASFAARAAIYRRTLLQHLTKNAPA